jgi:hypothetical protein
MSIVPDSTVPRGPLEALRRLLEEHGLHTVVEALAEACGWRAHHFASCGRFDTANRLNRAATAIDWVAHQHARHLNDGRAGQ